MIYKKIENFFKPYIADNYDDPLVFVGWAAMAVISFPVWFPFWVISKFWNTPNR